MDKLINNKRALGIFTLTNFIFAVYLNSSLNAVLAVVCFTAYMGIRNDKKD